MIPINQRKQKNQMTGLQVYNEFKYFTKKWVRLDVNKNGF